MSFSDNSVIAQQALAYMKNALTLLDEMDDQIAAAELDHVIHLVQSNLARDTNTSAD